MEIDEKKPVHFIVGTIDLDVLKVRPMTAENIKGYTLTETLPRQPSSL